MSEEHKKRISNALNNYLLKDIKELNKINGITPRKRNLRPEKEVETECLEWMRVRGWSVAILEAKATYDPRRGIYRTQGMKAGTLDCDGNMPDGVAVNIEFKARGKLQTFALDKNYRQQEYLNEKIKTGCFACVVDSCERLEMIYNQWLIKKQNSLSEAIEYLLSMVPKRMRGVLR